MMNFGFGNSKQFKQAFDVNVGKKSPAASRKKSPAPRNKSTAASNVIPAGNADVIRILPNYYIHLLDQNSNVTRVECGPQNFVKRDHEIVVLGPIEMITIPKLHYCVVDSPVVRDEEGDVVYDEKIGQAKLRYGVTEIRLDEFPYNEPFPLYAGESNGEVLPLEAVSHNQAFVLEAISDFDDHKVGDQWLLRGPGYFIPNVNVKKVGENDAIIITTEALKIRAKRDCKDEDGVDRVVGEEWLVTREGSYILGVAEELVDIVDTIVLTDRIALHLRASRAFTDVYDKKRKMGDEWLVTMDFSTTHVPSVNEEVVDQVVITKLNSLQYCVILDPQIEPGKNHLGAKKLVRGHTSFFVQPGESLESGIQDVYVLGEHDGLLLRAREVFEDSYVYSTGKDLPELETDGADPTPVRRRPGDRWMIRGPCEYVPPVEIEVVKTTNAIPLDDNEGVYVRNIKTGVVRMVYGETFMLDENEALHEKELPKVVEILLDAQLFARSFRTDFPVDTYKSPRDKTRLVTYRVPHNSVVQVHDYRDNTSRVIFGPDLIMLGPSEEITPLYLSGGTPKHSNTFITTLALLLGPYNCTDIVYVNTSDHTKLQIKLVYNWIYVLDKTDPVEASKLFSVPDFVGDLTKVCAAKIRGRVAQINFDTFHKNSAQIVEAAVFGTEEGKDHHDHQDLLFVTNNLHVTSIDVQSVKPVDEQTAKELSKSVTNAIKITTDSQEQYAEQQAKKKEQAANGELQRQKLKDDIAAEIVGKQLTELQAETEAVKSCGQAQAEAQARSEATLIEAKEAVEIARINAEAKSIKMETELRVLKQKNSAKLAYMKAKNEMEIDFRQRMADVEGKKFAEVVNSMTADAIRAIASSRQDLKAKLIEGLNIKSTLITDGKVPVNLFNTAGGLIG